MRRKMCFLTLAVIVIALPAIDAAQSKDGIVGTWRLVSASTSTDKGEVNSAVFGSHPTGFLTYTAEGRMMVIISDDGRKPLSVADKLTAPVEERAQAFSTFLAYGGKYTVAGDKVIHHVEVSSLQNWVGNDQVRFVNLQGDRLVLKSPPLPRGGALQTFEVVWERLK